MSNAVPAHVTFSALSATGKHFFNYAPQTELWVKHHAWEALANVSVYLYMFKVYMSVYSTLCDYLKKTMLLSPTILAPPLSMRHCQPPLTELTPTIDKFSKM